MKGIQLKTLFSTLLASTSFTLLAACSSGTAAMPSQADPVVIVVTATPTATARVVTATPTLTSEPAGEPAQTPAATPAPTHPAGSLLQGEDTGVFYLAEDGTRRHIYNWDTFMAFGFERRDIIHVGQDILQAIPLSGELTRLVFDDWDNLYWVVAGKRWRVNEWRPVVARTDYTGMPATPLTRALVASLPVRPGLERGTLLRDYGLVYYYDGEAVVPVAASTEGLANIIDVPPGVVGVYEQRSNLVTTKARLKADTPGANVRQGPGQQYPVINAVASADQLVVQGRSESGEWLQIRLHDQVGWLAANLVETNPMLALVATVETASPEASLPQAEPAAMVEPAATPQSVLCTDVPIRGFGQVWGDHPEIQAELGCPYSWLGGEQGTRAAVQAFEHGLMLWLEADSTYPEGGDPVYVLFEDGSFQRFGDLGPADPAKVGAVPAGFFSVGDKFSKVYWEGTGARVKERLGYATGQASDSAGAYQQFFNGRMFWLEKTDRIFVIYDYYRYENDQSIQVRTWHSYEDTF